MSNRRGCRDGGKPEKYTNEELSRVSDALASLSVVSSELKDMLWRNLPYDLRLEYNYCYWNYVGEPVRPACLAVSRPEV